MKIILTETYDGHHATTSIELDDGMHVVIDHDGVEINPPYDYQFLPTPPGEHLPAPEESPLPFGGTIAKATDRWVRRMAGGSRS